MSNPLRLAQPSHPLRTAPPPPTHTTTTSGTVFPYPEGVWPWEFVFVFLYSIVDLFRLVMSSRGNKTERVGPLIVALVLTAANVMGNIYYIALQTYVLRLDLILNGLAFAFMSVETVISIFAMLIFCRKSVL